MQGGSSGCPFAALLCLVANNPDSYRVFPVHEPPVFTGPRFFEFFYRPRKRLVPMTVCT